MVVKLLVVVVAILLLNLLVGYTVVSYHNINPIPGKSHNNEGGGGGGDLVLCHAIWFSMLGL